MNASISNPHHVSQHKPTQEGLQTLVAAHAVTSPTPQTGMFDARANTAAVLSRMYQPQAVEKALNYIQLVRGQLAGRAAHYEQFFKALEQYEKGSLELMDLLLRLMLICASAERPKLLQDLNYFLPPGYTFTLSMSTRRIELKMPTGTFVQPIEGGAFVF
ncbi:hypothetical protein OH77DRAFT_679229 [Trametes cingulata]|nr:hypothetical protein OH77DRAFT_679229 [Trametes cingulata]